MQEHWKPAHGIVNSLTDEQFAACNIYARAKDPRHVCREAEQIAEARKEYAEDLKISKSKQAKL